MTEVRSGSLRSAVSDITSSEREQKKHFQANHWNNSLTAGHERKLKRNKLWGYSTSGYLIHFGRFSCSPLHWNFALLEVKSRYPSRFSFSAVKVSEYNYKEEIFSRKPFAFVVKLIIFVKFFCCWNFVERMKNAEVSILVFFCVFKHSTSSFVFCVLWQ